MVNWLHHLFTPHYSNNHRARVLHVDSLSFYAIAFLAFYLCIHVVHQTFPDVLGYATDIRVDALLAGTNEQRRANGVGELTLNSQLSQAAAGKAQDMFANNYWAHTSPTGKLPWDFIVGAGYQYTVAGENLAKNFSDSSGVVQAWMNSPSHRENMVKGSYTDVGFAVVNGTLNGEETTLVVQMFGAPKNVAQAAPANTIVKPVQAEEPTPTVAPLALALPKATSVPVVSTVVPTVVVPTESPVALNVTSKPSSNVSSLVAAFRTPLVDIKSLTNIVTILFVGFLLGALALDAYLGFKKHVVRVAGHNVAHVLFLIVILIIIGTAVRGVIL